jgi:hypothetical protein
MLVPEVEVVEVVEGTPEMQVELHPPLLGRQLHL